MRFASVSGGAVFAAITLAFAAPATAATFSDGTFDTSNYVLAQYADAGVTASQGQTAGGNPGTALQGSYASSGGNLNGVLFTALNSTFVYDPSTSGAITSLSASLDRYFDPSVNGVSVNVGSYSLRVLAEQDGTIYQSIFTFGPFNTLGGTWQTLSQSGIQASDFKVFDPANFTAAGTATGLNYGGDAITFGFAMRASGPLDANGAPVIGPAAGDLRADNFSLSIGAAGVPEPATWAFMVMGFGLVGGALRQARRTAPRVTASRL